MIANGAVSDTFSPFVLLPPQFRFALDFPEALGDLAQALAPQSLDCPPQKSRYPSTPLFLESALALDGAHLRFFGARTGGARQNWSKPAISWESNLKTAVGPRISRITGITNIAPSVQSVQSVVNSRSEGNERRTTDYTDYTDYTDKEGIGVQGVYTRRVAAKEVLDHDEVLSGQGPAS